MAPSHRNILWVVFAVYVVVLFFGISHHELWGDELHSWNFATGSGGYFDLIHNIRYEGHPPVWYSVLWIISKFTHNLAYMQGAQFVLACGVAFVILFYSPYPIITRILIPFGYFLLYEYAVLSRNYAIGILPAFCICFIMHREFRGKTILYYLLLLITANAHLLGMILAGSIHLYYLLLQREQKKKTVTILGNLFAGGAILLVALNFIIPPFGSELNSGLWKGFWNVQQLRGISQSPLRSFLPMPAWWTYQFWNTEFLMEWKDKENIALLKIINPLVSLLLLGLAFFVLSKNRKSLVLFGANLLVTFFVAMVVFALTRARYAGFIYIGFLVAYWLYCRETPVNRLNQWVVNSILLIHVIAGVFAVAKDIKYPFSAWYQANTLLKHLPAKEKVVSDYWAIDAVVAFTDKPWYCIDIQKELSFAAWGNDLPRYANRPHRYYDGVSELFQREGINKLYMISTFTPAQLLKEDDLLQSSYRVTLVEQTTDAPIEKDGFLYLYQISKPEAVSLNH